MNKIAFLQGPNTVILEDGTERRIPSWLGQIMLADINSREDLFIPGERDPIHVDPRVLVYVQKLEQSERQLKDATANVARLEDQVRWLSNSLGDSDVLIAQQQRLIKDLETTVKTLSRVFGQESVPCHD